MRCAICGPGQILRDISAGGRNSGNFPYHPPHTTRRADRLSRPSPSLWDCKYSSAANARICAGSSLLRIRGSERNTSCLRLIFSCYPFISARHFFTLRFQPLIAVPLVIPSPRRSMTAQCNSPHCTKKSSSSKMDQIRGGLPHLGQFRMLVSFFISVHDFTFDDGLDDPFRDLRDEMVVSFPMYPNSSAARAHTCWSCPSSSAMRRIWVTAL